MRWGIVAGVLVAAAVLAGCEKPEEGGTLPPVASASPTPTASPSATPVASDVIQITALAKDYFAESNQALNTGNTRRLRSLFLPGCSSCVKGAEYVERHWKAGSLKAPDYWQVRQVTGATVSAPNYGYTNVVYTTGQELRLDPSGRTINVVPANPKPRAISVYFEKHSGVWKVSDVQTA